MEVEFVNVYVGEFEVEVVVETDNEVEVKVDIEVDILFHEFSKYLERN